MMPRLLDASVAQLVEHHVANVNVEGSNPFARSTFISVTSGARPRQAPSFTGDFSLFAPSPVATGCATFCPSRNRFQTRHHQDKSRANGRHRLACNLAAS